MNERTNERRKENRDVKVLKLEQKLKDYKTFLHNGVLRGFITPNNDFYDEYEKIRKL